MRLSAKRIRIMKTLYDNTRMVKTGAEVSPKIPISEGLMQGYCRSLLLLMYVDELILCASSPVDGNRKIDALKNYCDASQLIPNIDKTRVVVFQRGTKKKDIDTLY